MLPRHCFTSVMLEFSYDASLCMTAGLHLLVLPLHAFQPDSCYLAPSSPVYHPPQTNLLVTKNVYLFNSSGFFHYVCVFVCLFVFFFHM